MLDTIAEKKLKQVLEGCPERVILSNRRDGAYAYKKTVMRKILLKGKMVYQIERFTEKQVFHENLTVDNLLDEVLGLFPRVYTQLNIFGEKEQWDYKVTKKGKLLVNAHSQTPSKKISVAGDPPCRQQSQKKLYYTGRYGGAPSCGFGDFYKGGKSG